MKPILFNTDMVRALLDGRKTVTRRVIKGIPDNYKEFQGWVTSTTGNKKIIGSAIFGCGCSCEYIKPPYQKGDILYVRETWCQLHPLDDNMVTQTGEDKYYYAADGYNPTPFNAFLDDDGFYGGRDCPRWHPSIHMPREAARIFLKVTDVRVERLQDITWQQALAEGIDHDKGQDEEICNYCPCEDSFKGVHNYGGEPSFCVDSGMCETAHLHFEDDCIDCFSELWDSTVKKQDLSTYGWNANPWVWAIEFELIEKESSENAKDNN